MTIHILPNGEELLGDELDPDLEDALKRWQTAAMWYQQSDEEFDAYRRLCDHYDDWRPSDEKPDWKSDRAEGLRLQESLDKDRHENTRAALWFYQVWRERTGFLPLSVAMEVQWHLECCHLDPID